MIKIATFKGYSYDASYYINCDATGYTYSNTLDNKQANADLVYALMQEHYGKSACIVGCPESSGEDFGYPDYGSQLLGDLIEYTISYNPLELIAYERFYADNKESYWSMRCWVTMPVKTSLLPWQERGLSYTATGYGAKIPTTRMVRWNSRWHRVYCAVYANSGLPYIHIYGVDVTIYEQNMITRS